MSALHPLPWHAEARRLYAGGAGMRPCDIARRLNQALTSVKWAVDHLGYRNRNAERLRIAKLSSAPPGDLRTIEGKKGAITLAPLRFMGSNR